MTRKTNKYRPAMSAASFLLGLLAMATATAAGDAATGGRPPEAVVASLTDRHLSDAAKAKLTALQDRLLKQVVRDGAELAKRYPVGISASRPPRGTATATYLDLIQKSPFALGPEALAKLAGTDIAVVSRSEMPAFAGLYEQLYKADLPVYITAGSLLHAMRRSFDDVLQGIEEEYLVDMLANLVKRMRSKLASGAAAAAESNAARAEVDEYLTVAAALLKPDTCPDQGSRSALEDPFGDGSAARREEKARTTSDSLGAGVAPVAGGQAARVAGVLGSICEATGTAELAVFGSRQLVDFSQFQPRGHYTKSARLRAYFRAFSWLSRLDLRIVESNLYGKLGVNRSALAAARSVLDLLGPDEMAVWSRIDRILETVAGAADSMGPKELSEMLEMLEQEGAGDALAVADDRLLALVLQGGYGAQRIAGHVLAAGPGVTHLPLARSFALLGNRYGVDSHALSYGANGGEGAGLTDRPIPSPLDVAFGVLGNNYAARLLASDLETHRWLPAVLDRVRALSAEETAATWGGNMYHLWLRMLTGLSADSGMGGPDGVKLPTPLNTESWYRILLSTQLSAWAGLRHDTVLYTKESYGGLGITCEFPDAFVDPYPSFFRAMKAYAERGVALARLLPAEGDEDALGSRVRGYYEGVARVAGQLGEIAEAELRGARISPAHLRFINEAVAVKRENIGCEELVTAVDGWYGSLYFRSLDALEQDPIIAAVHTQVGGKESGSAGRILHVADGAPRQLVIVVRRPQGGPVAFVGFIPSYYEGTTSDYRRITDEEWSTRVGRSAEVVEPGWMSDVVVADGELRESPSAAESSDPEKKIRVLTPRQRRAPRSNPGSVRP
ncbi:MAG: DUF3160 domain-containing protein [Candidatus Schekmanbacteria bacterium]|nr:DUF3160 domain-containing protein [Candidatus Schekmanbacteria bacterium]